MATTNNLEIFGIRHHGPGSAKTLLRALEAYQPDVVLIEGPPDAEALLPLAANADMQPPVALLVYDPKNLSQASFFPFAEFSPEWQAILFAVQAKIPLRMMDLPMAISFGLREEARQQTLQFSPENTGVLDPFREIAVLAGYADPERWWEAVVEGPGSADSDGVATFALLLELMQTLRESKSLPETRETLLREAWMRHTIRTAQKEGFSKIAVICGAWHGPALITVNTIKASADAALLKGLKKIKTESVWIPWSFDRLASQHGYSAGVIAPAWYRVLFSTPTHLATTVWFTQAARLLREHQIDVSAAHVIEAVRLADLLASLRMLAVPGIEELREAAITVLCDGAEKQLDLIDKQLVIGDVLGAIPANLQLPPLKADFEAQVKSCRLERSTVVKTLDLNLREAAQLRKSQLLHRLLLIGLNWGKLLPTPDGKHGSFHEYWDLKWLPDFEIQLIEAGTWGNTVEEAASRLTHKKLLSTDTVPELTTMLGNVLKADLSAITPDILAKLRRVATLATDIPALATAVLPLVEILRYGSARQLDLSAIQNLLDQLVPRVCLHLPLACTGIDEDQTLEMKKILLATNRGLGLLNESAHEGIWNQALEQIAGDLQTASLLAGLSNRLLFDKNLISAPDLARKMQFEWSRASDPYARAQWLEGLLHGSGLLLLHYAELWEIIDNWVTQLSDEEFREIVPLLRRSFSSFSAAEREKMLDLVKKGPDISPKSADLPEWDAARTAGLQELLLQLLS